MHEGAGKRVGSPFCIDRDQIMKADITKRISDFVASKTKVALFPPATSQEVEEAEQRLSMQLPTVLSQLLIHVSNGGFGPGYGLIGVGRGHKSDFGNLVDTYLRLRNDWQECGDTWPIHLLPFCEFGDNIFTCIDLDDHSRIYLSTDSQIHRMSCDIIGFFDKWIAGYKFLNDLPKQKKRNFPNPFINTSKSEDL